MSYCYLQVTRGIQIGRRYLLPDGAVSVGRSSQNTIVINSAERNVSGHHLIIYKSPERIMVQDLQSTNGTFVNEMKIVEQEIAAGDEIGFGKSGPRLKLIISETELDTSGASGADGLNSGIKTHEDSTSPFLKRDALRQGREFSYLNASSVKPIEKTGKDTEDTSLTVEMEQKLRDKMIGAGDLKKLMKNGKRLDRILEGGKLGQTQTNMLRTMFDASRSTRRRWLWAVFAILVASAAVIAFFAIRAFQYSQTIEKAQMLKKDLEEYDKRIASAKSNPDANRQNLQRLIGEMEAKEKSFSSLQNRIDQDDFGKFYADPVERDIDQVLMRFGESDYHIPREMIARVKHHIGVYSGDLHDMIGRYLKRKQKYFTMIQRTFRAKNLPVDLAYVSMLESGFNPNALSHAGARGMWQFMPATGRRYGMAVESARDERTDPVKATVAAASYFKELIGIFGGKSSVMLCMAAYNAGEGRIMNALRKIEDPMRNRDFWYIYRMGYLAEETNEYIPRVIALIIISENPERFGFPSTVTTDTGVIETANDFVEINAARQK